MNYLIEIGFIGINIGMAAWHAHLIKHQRPIKHCLWGLLYAIFVAGVWLSQNQPIVCICLVLIRETIFSPVLNYFRGLGFFYRSSTSGSLLDKWQGALLLPIYITCVAALIVLQLYL